jgi:replication-associated recombination protein RarA
MINHLFWEKWRPQTIEDTVLLPRLRKVLESEVKYNLILAGPPGCGKSTVCKIITKDYPSISFNGSFYSSVDLLRTDIDRFCKVMPMMNDKKYDTKIVYLDEFDGVSSTFQEALRGFIEQYEGNVRFITTVNNLSKISDALRSRFITLNFEPIDKNEEKYLLNNYYKRVKEVILPNEPNINIDEKDLKNMLVKYFPDFRGFLNNLGMVGESGVISTESSNTSSIVKDNLYKFIFNESDSGDVFNFVLHTFGNDKIEQLIKILGSDLIKHTMINKKDLISKMPDVANIVVKYNSYYKETMDPVLLGYSLICEIKNTIR